MRTVLITGPGGAGRTTVAAAAAAASARRGRRTLLLSQDSGNALDTLLDTSAGAPDGAAVPVPAVPGLWACRIDAEASFRADATRLQDRLGALLDLFGTTPLDPEELTTLPGAGTLALLRALGTAAAGEWDAVVADLPDTPAATAALALPEQLRRYLSRLVPPQRQAARSLRPVFAQLAGVPMPAEWAYEAAGHAERELAAAQAVIEDRATTVRLVLEPGPHAAHALRTARAGLALFGHRLDAVVANRLLPTGSADPFLAGLSGQQQKHLKALHEEFATEDGTVVRELPHLGHDPRGPEDLDALATDLEDLPDGLAARPWAVEDRLADEGHFLWLLPLPGATRDTLDLARRGDELVIDAEGFRRIVPLPSALRRCTVSGASLRDGALQVRFTPDPALWPR